MLSQAFCLNSVSCSGHDLVMLPQFPFLKNERIILPWSQVVRAKVVIGEMLLCNKWS